MVLEELTFLTRLQQIDNHLMELEAERGDLPEQLGNLRKEITRFTTSIKDAEKGLSETAILKRQQELNIESAKDRLKKSQGVLFSVKTTREYDAISSEIEQAKHQIADGEKQILELIAREEDLNSLMSQHKDKMSVFQSEFEDKQSEMQERLDVSKDEELRLQHEREKIVVRLKKPVYAHYERIRKIRDGVGVASLSDGACSYCFSMIPPQRQAEVKRMDDLILCEVCGCILVVN
jgi:predicted  nucleic acid-binding Zn-ribbon protein